MDSEKKGKSNNCETGETPMDSSSVKNNNILKEGVKKVLSANSVNIDDCTMDIDTEENLSPSDKYSEKKNGIHEENNKKENQKTDQISKEKVSSNHEQNNIDEKDLSDTLNSKDSVSVQQGEQKQRKKFEDKEQSADKNVETVSNTSGHEDQKNESDSNSQSTDVEKPMDADISSEKNSKSDSSSTVISEKHDSANDNVRPEKAVSSESAASDNAVDVNSSKTDSASDKETKDNSNSEVTSEASNSKNKASKKVNDSGPAETTKTESTKKEETTVKKKKSKICEECGVKKGLKFQVLFKGKTRFLCSDTCFKNFKSKQMQAKAPAEVPAAPAPEKPSVEKCVQCQKDISTDQGFFPVVGEAKPLCSEECMKKYHADNIPAKNCSQCKKVIENPQSADILTWETMVFCNEDCLGKYQSYLGSHCTCCQSPVPQASLGKYSVCFGADIRQFCSCSCLDEFKKNLKVCSFCQTDLSAGIDSFLAPVGDKGQFKDFCSQNCMERYEIMNNISKSTPQAQVCSHCKKQGTFKIQVKQDQTYSLCSDMCVAGFRCVHKIKDKMCDTCFNFFNMAPEKDKEFSFKFDGQFKQFCTKACMTLFVLSHRKIVACVSCKVKKYNFDMIEKTDSNSQTQIFCSLNCLSLYRVSVNATSSKSVRCDNCTKNLPAQYHLTMSDGSVRNFCTYNCVMLFQNQYTNVCTLTTTSATRQTSASASTSTSKTSSATSTPVISNVVSLAPATPRIAGPTLIRNIVPPKLVPARQPLQPLAIIGSKSASSTITSPSTLSAVTNASGQQVIREVIVKPPAPKSQKNKSVACKPIMQNKGINVKPQPCHKAVQTEDRPRPILLPVPVPFYVPVPIHMFSRPVPCPVPFPVPMFVPLVAPAKDSPSQERVPSASGENNSLASDKKSDEGFNNRIDSSKEGNSSQKENDEKCDKDSYPAKVDEPSSSATSDEFHDNNELEEDEYVFKDGKSHHGKRHSHHKNKGRKKSKLESVNNESHNSLPAQDRSLPIPSEQLEPVPRLKQILGVNAWKQWIIQKNEQMVRGSQSSRKFKLFKTDLLQLPPDELNYSLSLFVKEVRKPNTKPYGCGSIYYLCLGIQKYLYLNGRIDNIFSDPYYEKFTECLNDILGHQDSMPSSMKGFSLTRVEEEALWESKQLGAHSPYALLNTVMYFNTRFFKFKTPEEHLQLSFNHMLAIDERKVPDRPERTAYLRYFPMGRKCDKADCKHAPNICYGRKCLLPGCKHKDRKDSVCFGRNCGLTDCKHKRGCIDSPRKDPSENPFQQIEIAADSMRCPVRLYDFYLSKCPENCRNRGDMFYLHPERSCVPDSAMWYSTVPLSYDVVSKMINRIKIVREIYED